MNSPAVRLRLPIRPVNTVAAVTTTASLAIAVSLVLAGCGGSGSTSAGSASHPASSSPASSSSASSTSSSNSVTSASTVPFPVGVGDTWTYKTTYGQTINKMTAVTPVSGGQQVTMTTSSTVLGSTSQNTAYYVINSDGSITLPFSQFSTSSSGSSVKLISGSLFWPPAAELASGQASHDTLKIEFSEGGVTKRVTAYVTVKGEGTQSVTVPAGTYTATVVNMTMSETIDGITVGDTVTSWLAQGVGPVKSEVTINEAGTDHVEAEDQLTSFKAG
jgi:hypothetical protein